MTLLKQSHFLIIALLFITQQHFAQNTSDRIERLTFSYSDFFDTDDNYKYENDEAKMPWNDPYKMIESLKNNKQLVYTYSKLIDDSDDFETKTLTADIKANADNPSLSIDYIFYGYDRYNLPDDADLPPNDYDVEYGNLHYPLNEMPCRIADNAELTTKAGTFDCIIIEAVGTSEELYKLWMIKDKPGVYAKIIVDKPGMWGYYLTFELNNIK